MSAPPPFFAPVFQSQSSTSWEFELTIRYTRHHRRRRPRKWTIMACFHHYFGKWQV